jgi:hypothetical protein
MEPGRGVVRAGLDVGTPVPLQVYVILSTIVRTNMRNVKYDSTD